MIESPVLQELKAEWTREAAREAHRRDIIDVLVTRFGASAEVVETDLNTIDDEQRLKHFVKLAAVCTDLEAFRGQLAT
jgi:hypothetical protein